MKFNPNKSPIYVVLFATLISGAFTAAIMGLHVATRPIVAANERLLVEKAIVDVFGLGETDEMSADAVSDLIRSRVAGLSDPARPGDQRAKEIFLMDEQSGERVRILVAYKTDLPADRAPDIHDKQNIVGYAFEIRGVGFWAMIDGWLAVEPEGDRALGVVFTRHQETPGLGGRITEMDFRKHFKGLDVSPPVEGGRFIYVETFKPTSGSEKEKRHVDAITGATGTSTAVGVFINADIARFRRVAEAAGLIERGGG